MSTRQALFRSAIRLYSSPAIQGWKTRVSAALLPIWPTGTLDTAQIEARARATLSTGEARWLAIPGPIDINGGSGLLYRGKTRLDPSCYSVSNAAADDLTVHFGGRIIKREPALVLFNGRETGIGAFASEILPRLVALDRLGIPVQTLLLVTLDMARRSFFQRALLDGVFRPRPVEVLRPSTAVRTDMLHHVELAAPDPDLLRSGAMRLAALYGPFETRSAALVLADGAEELARFRRRIATEPLLKALDDARILDIAKASLGEITRAVGSASILAGSALNLRAIALAPLANRRLISLGGDLALAAPIAAMLGEGAIETS